jgi:putative transposase
MAPLCYLRHRFPPEIIQHAIWLYLRFTLSDRDVEELLAERGLDISYETVRRWVLKFGPGIARRLRRRRPRPSDRWHLDEMVVRIAGKRMYLWRAVDREGEVLDMLVQPRRDTRAAGKRNLIYASHSRWSSFGKPSRARWIKFSEFSREKVLTPDSRI